jgi:hypothetical protein
MSAPAPPEPRAPAPFLLLTREDEMTYPHEDQDFIRDHSERLVAIETLLKSVISDYLVTIKDQTMKTNGRVTALEARVGTLEQVATRNRDWIWFLWIGLGSVGGSLGTVLVMHVFGAK